jgi:predicted peptidase
MFLEGFALIFLVLFWGGAGWVEEPREPSVPPDASPARPFPPRALLPTVRWWTLGFLCICTAISILSPSAAVAFLYPSYRDSDGAEFKYALFIPHNYQPDRAYALLVYLHGSGPRSWDRIRAPQEPLAAAIREQESTFDMLVAFPQSATGTWEPDSPDLQRVLRVVDDVKAAYHVDAERISLTGMSRGAFGVWSLAAAHPDMWAAIVPVCGGGNPQDAAKIRRIPCWCFHGALDDVVPVDQSRRMINALRQAGASPRYHEYPDLGHNCWDRVYRAHDLFRWLKAQKSAR